ncbi:hypothetical protein JQ615_36335 [Bradyrhizobium jicamae]|uniref:ATPase n=1 Tax=Bradyrhizobium jicamae TaxID=280332 RepID=A0ABS5FVU4_9BRAD|nr:hypothetical protein [Bradyrhizobium jicamae]
MTSENVLGFSRPTSPPETGAQTLELVYQAAELFRGIEDRVRVSELRAEAAERARLDIINATERKLLDASEALEEAHKRIEAQQDRLAAFEFRAETAEAEARDARRTLELVDDAIRRRLLLPNRGADDRSTDVT